MTESLEKGFYEFERKYFSKYFLEKDTDLKWNYYLITKLEKQKRKKNFLLKECVHREQELEQEYKNQWTKIFLFQSRNGRSIS